MGHPTCGVMHSVMCSRSWLNVTTPTRERIRCTDDTAINTAVTSCLLHSSETVNRISCVEANHRRSIQHIWHVYWALKVRGITIIVYHKLMTVTFVDSHGMPSSQSSKWAQDAVLNAEMQSRLSGGKLRWSAVNCLAELALWQSESANNINTCHRIKKQFWFNDYGNNSMQNIPGIQFHSHLH